MLILASKQGQVQIFRGIPDGAARGKFPHLDARNITFMSDMDDFFYFIYHKRCIAKSIEQNKARRRKNAEKRLFVSKPGGEGGPCSTDIINCLMMASLIQVLSNALLKK